MSIGLKTAGRTAAAGRRLPTRTFHESRRPQPQGVGP
jgi:hypothetical protein